MKKTALFILLALTARTSKADEPFLTSAVSFSAGYLAEDITEKALFKLGVPRNYSKAAGFTVSSILAVLAGNYRQEYSPGLIEQGGLVAAFTNDFQKMPSKKTPTVSFSLRF